MVKFIEISNSIVSVRTNIAIFTKSIDFLYTAQRCVLPVSIPVDLFFFLEKPVFFRAKYNTVIRRGPNAILSLLLSGLKMGNSIDSDSGPPRYVF